MFFKKQKFFCRRCGYCCMLYVTLSDKDIKRIKKASYVKENNLKEENYILSAGFGKKKIKIPGYFCYFLGINKGLPFCKIYKHRPETCRMYPFFPDGTAVCQPGKLFKDEIDFKPKSRK